MARSRVPSEKDNPLSAFDLEADTQSDHTSLLAVGRRWAGARKADTLATLEGRASRRTWLVFGLGALALIQVPFVVMWALQPQTVPVTAAVAPAVQEAARI